MNEIRMPEPDQLARLPEEIAKLGEEVTTLRERWRQADLKLDSLQADLEAAPRMDAEASAKALRAGQKDPGTPLTAKATKAVEAHEAQVRALEIAVESAEADLMAAIEQHRNSLSSELDAEHTSQREECLRRALELQELIGERNDTRRLIAWLKRPTAGAKNFDMGSSDRLRKANGEAVGTVELIRELVEIFEPDVEINPNTGRPVSETPRNKGNAPQPRPARVS